MKEGDFMYATHLSKHNKCLIAGLCLSFKHTDKQKTRAKNGENAFLLRVASVAKRECDL